MINYGGNRRKKGLKIGLIAAGAVCLIGIVTVIILLRLHPGEKAVIEEELVKEEAAVEKEAQKILYLYMPDVVGSMEEETLTKLDNLGFYNVKVVKEKSETAEAGRVVRQSIPPDTTVGTDFEITIYVAE